MATSTPNLRLIPGWILAAVLSILAPVAAARQEAQVFVDSVAAPAYGEMKEKMKTVGWSETVTFAEGQMTPGQMNDESIKAVPFIDLVTELGKAMESEGYLPAANPEESDVFVVVHWGVAEPPDDWTDLTDFDSRDVTDSDNTTREFDGYVSPTATADPDHMSTVRPDITIRGKQSKADIARLLGIERHLSLYTTKPTSRDIELESMLEERRYYVVLMAYDTRRLLKDKSHHLLWTTRFSVDSRRTNFEESYRALARAAAPYIGKTTTKPTVQHTHMGQGDVTAGELQVLGIEEDEADDPKN